MIMEKDTAVEDLAVFMDMFEIKVGSNLNDKIQATSKFFKDVRKADRYISLEKTAVVVRKVREKQLRKEATKTRYSFTCI